MSYILDNSSFSDLANDVQLEIDSTLNASVVATWFRSNISLLNNRIHTCYTINQTSGEATDVFQTVWTDNSDVPNSMTPIKLGTREAIIFKMMYLIYYYDTRIRSNLGASALSISTVTSDGANVRLVTYVDTAKAYQQIRKDTVIDLEKLIAAYNIDQSIPLSVTGDDDFAGKITYISAANRIRGYQTSL